MSGARSTTQIPTVPDDDLREVLRLATTIAADAGNIALSYWHQGVEWLEKSPRDLVSVADQTVETFIAERLGAAFPNDDVLGEEGTRSASGSERHGRCWYVDPIDGTTNYLKGLPNWGISMGLAAADGALLVGVVVLPVTGEVFCAAKGHGATRNGVAIHVSDVDRLDRTLVTYALTGSSGDQWAAHGGLSSGVRALMATTLGTRMQGCSVADLTSVAMGRIDATIAGGMSEWDVAAGLLIAAEAGAVITTPDGTTSRGPDLAFVASSPGVHDAIRQVLADNGAIH